MYACHQEPGPSQRSFVRSRTASSQSRSSSLCARRPYSHRRITKKSALNVATVTKDMPKSKGPAFFRNNLVDGRDNVHAESSLIEPLSHPTYDALQVIERGMHSGEGIQGCSIYTGTGGVAYMFLRLAESLRRSQSLIAQHPKQPLAKLTPECLLRRAEEYGHWANHLSHRHTKRVTFLEGHPGCLALQTAIASLLGKTAQVQHSMQELESWGPRVLHMPSTECEILYGRCGFLHALLFARKYVGPTPTSTRLIKQLVQQVVEEGRRGARELRTQDPSSKWEMMWSWHGSYYLGGAHGVCGILLTLMQCYPELEELYPGQASSLLANGVSSLLGQTAPSGNLLSSLGSENDKYVQWCHGAPSLIPLLAKAAEVLDGHMSQEVILGAAKKAADVVWQQGLLTKGVGLCHGMSGNAYAFMSLYRVTKDDLYKERAQQFAQVMADHWKELKDIPDAPLSLFEVRRVAVSMKYWCIVSP
ncbi:hypothetical protein ABBQ38_009021 [Trebouxia sp. C0009 RCD-2024]